MQEFLPLVVLSLIFLVGLILIPLGLPGVWLMVLGLIGYAILDGFEHVGPWVVAFAVVLAAAGEAMDIVVGFGMTKKYGGSSRAGWGAILGGLAGAIVGTPVPLVGNVVGAFVGAFVGAVLLEAAGHREVRKSLSAGWGALLGKAAAAAVKVAIGLTIAVVGIFSALT